jgi:hypothetical protein
MYNVTDPLDNSLAYKCKGRVPERKPGAPEANRVNPVDAEAKDPGKNKFND